MSRATARSIVFLKPGDCFVGDARWRMRTLLGSCVSITLWHPGRRIGAMSHFLLSTRGGAGSGPPDARYGDEALSIMLEQLARMKVPVRECEAKIVGGGDMFPGQASKRLTHVGQANGQAARRMLRERGLAVRSESLFGIGHRQVIFDVASGHVWSRQVSPPEGEGAAEEAT